MQHPLTKALGIALLSVALLTARHGHAEGARPVVRVVLVQADTPPWFDGFVKHLVRELGLRGIDVVVARSERDATAPRTARSSANGAGADAELVVDAPSVLRPVLRFSAPSRDQAARQVGLAGIPADGWALALAVAADELMRSNWPRAVPSEAARAMAEEGKGSPTNAVEESGPAAVKGPADGERAPAAKAGAEMPSVEARSAPSGENAPGDAADMRAGSSGAGSGFRQAIGLAAAVEAFGGGQTQMGADARWAVRIVPRLEVELRGGWRHILRQQTVNGAIDGNALLAGGALRILALGGARASLVLVGRADLLRVAYSGDPRDGVDGTSDSGFGFILAAGPCGRLALTRALGLQAEVLAGASPYAVTATDAGKPVFATNGAAVLGSLGLSLGL